MFERMRAALLNGYCVSIIHSIKLCFSYSLCIEDVRVMSSVQSGRNLLGSVIFLYFYVCIQLDINIIFLIFKILHSNAWILWTDLQKLNEVMHAARLLLTLLRDIISSSFCYALL